MDQFLIHIDWQHILPPQETGGRYRVLLIFKTQSYKDNGVALICR